MDSFNKICLLCFFLITNATFSICYADPNKQTPAAKSKPVGLKQHDKHSPNVLLIVCDDLNSHVSPSGYQDIHTPAMQRLANSGLRMTRAYCQYPVCGPSRSSFLSSLYPESTGVLDNKSDIREVRPGTVSLPQWFKNHGYWTAGVGKIFHNTKTDPGKIAWHQNHRFENQWNPVLKPIQEKFEQQFGSIDLPKNKRAWREKLQSIRHLVSGQTPPGFGPTTMTDAQHKDGKNARQIVKWLDQKTFQDKPFFMICGIQKPHVPYWAPQKYFDLYPTEKIQIAKQPINDWDDIPKLALNHRYREFGFKSAVENDLLRRKYMQAYHACISFVDAQIDLMLDALARNNLEKNTIVILTSDHGYHLGEHYLWGKVTLFEVCAKVPLVVRVPGKTQANTKTAGLIELIDLFPTLCELCKIDKPDDLQGTSFVNLLEEPEGQGKDIAYTVVSRGLKLGRSIRTSQWRYAEWASEKENELYDLSSDPDEFTNLATSPDHQIIVNELRDKLKQKIKEASHFRINNN